MVLLLTGSGAARSGDRFQICPLNRFINGVVTVKLAPNSLSRKTFAASGQHPRFDERLFIDLGIKILIPDGRGFPLNRLPDHATESAMKWDFSTVWGRWSSGLCAAPDHLCDPGRRHHRRRRGRRPEIDLRSGRLAGGPREGGPEPVRIPQHGRDPLEGRTS